MIFLATIRSSAFALRISSIGFSAVVQERTFFFSFKVVDCSYYYSVNIGKRYRPVIAAKNFILKIDNRMYQKVCTEREVDKPIIEKYTLKIIVIVWKTFQYVFCNFRWWQTYAGCELTDQGCGAIRTLRSMNMIPNRDIVFTQKYMRICFFNRTYQVCSNVLNNVDRVILEEIILFFSEVPQAI